MIQDFVLDVKLKMDLDVDGISARCDLCSWTWSSVDSSEYCAECRKIAQMTVLHVKEQEK